MTILKKKEHEIKQYIICVGSNIYLFLSTLLYFLFIYLFLNDFFFNLFIVTGNKAHLDSTSVKISK